MRGIPVPALRKLMRAIADATQLEPQSARLHYKGSFTLAKDGEWSIKGSANLLTVSVTGVPVAAGIDRDTELDSEGDFELEVNYAR